MQRCEGRDQATLRLQTLRCLFIPGDDLVICNCQGTARGQRADRGRETITTCVTRRQIDAYGSVLQDAITKTIHFINTESKHTHTHAQRYSVLGIQTIHLQELNAHIK